MTTYSPMSKEFCSKNDIQKTATGYTTDNVCSMNGVSITSHSETMGDFNSAYTVKLTTHHDAASLSIAMTIEAKWLGACKADQKPGDIVMPGGFGMNVTDPEKHRGLMAPAK
jgi:hypothetical protein